MGYLVLARKWRPRVFADVIGQDHVTHTLLKAVEKERLAHAYLFSGPRGCGKTSTARLLAKAINCEDRKGSEPCDKCSSCLAVNDGSHLDMIEIDGASNRGIDEIRDLREKIGYASSQGKSKIYIIDEVHMLTQQAFNALLKTLEEPPPHVYFIFATTEPHKVPATILSRCQRFNFKRLELSELESQLEKICKSEKIAFDREALLLVSRRADGSMRDAESLLDQCISALEDKVDLETVRRVLGLVDASIIIELLDSISRHDRKGALEVVDSVVSSGLDLEEFFLAYIEGIRNLLVLSIEKDGASERLDMTGEEIKKLGAITEAFRTEDLLYLFRTASRTYRDLKGASNPRYLVEASVAEAASWESAVDITELINRIEGSGASAPKTPQGGAKKVSGPSGRTSRPPRQGASGKQAAGTASDQHYRPADEAANASMAKAAGKPSGEDGDSGPGNMIDIDPSRGEDQGAYARMGGSPSPGPAHDDPALALLGGKEQWERFLAQIREAKLTLGIWLMSARVAGIEGDKIRLTFSSQNRFAREMVKEEKNRRYIESHLERFYGRKYIVETAESANIQPHEAVADEQPEQAAGHSSSMDKDIEKLVEETPALKLMLDEFDGDIRREK